MCRIKLLSRDLCFLESLPVADGCTGKSQMFVRLVDTWETYGVPVYKSVYVEQRHVPWLRNKCSIDVNARHVCFYRQKKKTTKFKYCNDCFYRQKKKMKVKYSNNAVILYEKGVCIWNASSWWICCKESYIDLFLRTLWCHTTFCL